MPALPSGGTTIQLSCSFADGILRLALEVNGAQLIGTSDPGPDPLLDRAGVVLFTKRLGSSARFDRITIT